MRMEFFKIKVILLLIFLFQNQLVIGNETSQFEQERYYVAKEDISICDEGIIILGGASLILVDSLFHDPCGFYFLPTGSGWICNWCKEVNPLDVGRCQVCGKPYGSRPPPKK